MSTMNINKDGAKLQIESHYLANLNLGHLDLDLIHLAIVTAYQQAHESSNVA